MPRNKRLSTLKFRNETSRNTTPEMEEMLGHLDKRISLELVAKQRLRRASKIPFQIPQGRILDDNIRNNTDARLKSVDYANNQRSRIKY